MTTDYNAIAAQYKQCKEHPWRSRIETYSIMKRLGNVEGKKVLDVACGEGFYARKLKQGGASEVVGIDLSEAMIRLALDQESRHPLGITYRVEDACTERAQQEFDLAVSAWLLVYARNQTELLAMCRGLASRLKSGGRFVTFTGNLNLYAFTQVDYRSMVSLLRSPTAHTKELQSSGRSISTTLHSRSRTTIYPCRRMRRRLLRQDSMISRFICRRSLHIRRAWMMGHSGRITLRSLLQY
jgi:2-polyprenyl-3-methyl-5-hydroxy-6-metoxy-1,4-benzoquinol methylase